jgi:hypothetical protein
LLLPLPLLLCLSFRSAAEESAFAFALVFLVVIPEGESAFVVAFFCCHPAP